jgi:hypothetical protein
MNLGSAFGSKHPRQASRTPIGRHRLDKPTGKDDSPFDQKALAGTLFQQLSQPPSARVYLFDRISIGLEAPYPDGTVHQGHSRVAAHGFAATRRRCAALSGSPPLGGHHAITASDWGDHGSDA